MEHLTKKDVEQCSTSLKRDFYQTIENHPNKVLIVEALVGLKEDDPVFALGCILSRGVNQANHQVNLTQEQIERLSIDFNRMLKIMAAIESHLNPKNQTDDQKKTNQLLFQLKDRIDHLYKYSVHKLYWAGAFFFGGVVTGLVLSTEWSLYSMV